MSRRVSTSKKERIAYTPEKPKPLALRIKQIRSVENQPEMAIKSFDSEVLANQNLLKATLKYLLFEMVTAKDILKWN